MASYGYHGGSKMMRRFPVSNTAAIAQGDLLKIETVTIGGVDNCSAVTPCGAGDKPVAVAAEKCDVPTTDGQYTVLCYVSSDTYFAYPAVTGTINVTLRFKTMDVGGAQSIDIDASTDDIVYCWDVDEVNDVLIVSFDFKSVFTGIV